MTTIAGTGRADFAGDGGRATAADLNFVHDAAELPDGGYVLADSLNHRIRRVWPDGRITTVAGTGEENYYGDGGPATEAAISFPRGVGGLPDGGQNGVVFAAMDHPDLAAPTLVVTYSIG